MAEINEEFVQALLSLNRLAAKRIVAEISGALTPLEIAEGMIVKSLERIGEGWQKGVVALSQVYMSGRICEELMDELLPPGAPDRKNRPPMAIATLEDYHMLGKRIVYSVLQLKSACPDVKVVVGGAPFLFDPELWREVGADAMGRSASEAAVVIERVAGGAP